MHKGHGVDRARADARRARAGRVAVLRRTTIGPTRTRFARYARRNRQPSRCSSATDSGILTTGAEFSVADPDDVRLLLEAIVEQRRAS